MAFKLPNRVRMSITGTPGTGDVSLNVVTSGYQTLANAGLADGDTFPYVIEDGANWELGVGTYHSSGPSFSRTTVRASSSGGTSKISATSSAIIFSSIMGEDAGGGAPALSGLTDVTLTSPANNDLLTYDTGSGKWVNAAATGGGSTFTPPVSTNFTAITNLNSATLTDRASGAVPSLHVTPGSDSNADLYCALQAAPVGSFSLVMKVRTNLIGTATGWNGCGPVIHNSGNGNAMMDWMTASNGPAFWVGSWTGAFTSGSPSVGTACADGDVFMHLDYDGTNVKCGISRNGKDVLWGATATLASFMVAITHVGFGWSGSAASMEHDIFHFHAGALGTTGL